MTATGALFAECAIGETSRVRSKIAKLLVFGAAIGGIGAVAGYEWWKHAVRRAPSMRFGLQALGGRVKPPSNCPSGTSLYVHFDFRAQDGSRLEASPWQRGRRYELRVSADGDRYSCNFEVPLRPKRSMLLPRVDVATGRTLPVDPTLDSECDEYDTFTLSELWEPAGLGALGGTSRISVQILSGGSVFYAGTVSPRYDALADDCSSNVRIELRSQAPEERND